jgi:hypothetical protein
MSWHLGSCGTPNLSKKMYMYMYVLIISNHERLRPVSTRAFYLDGILRGGNFHRHWTSRKALALLIEQRQCPLPVVRFPCRKTL